MRGYDLVAQAAAEATIFARISRNGGSAGAPSVLSCADHPFSVKTSWLATASHQSTTPRNLPSALVDGTNARWSSGKAQSGDEWIQIDFGSTVSLRSINLQQGSDTNDYPRSYAVIISEHQKRSDGRRARERHRYERRHNHHPIAEGDCRSLLVDQATGQLARLVVHRRSRTELRRRLRLNVWLSLGSFLGSPRGRSRALRCASLQLLLENVVYKSVTIGYVSYRTDRNCSLNT